jgi:RND family efflux transporter MFP subunit
MNYEARLSPAEAQPATAGDWFDDEAARDGARRRRRAIIIGAIILLLVAVAAWFAFGRASEQAPQGAAAAEGGAAGEEGSDQAPRVTVATPGRQLVNTVITATGNLTARREMPVGVAGEGGQVLRVLVEPGQWVRAGQVLAVVDRQVQVQQIAQLEASIRVAQADANLAQSELNRAQALVERGFISRADIERRTAQRDSAAARVRVAQAQLAESRARTGRLDIRAPAAGLVLTRGVEPGQVIGAGSGVLFRMARGGEMELQAQLSEADLARVSVGSRATVRPVGAARDFDGQIWQISPVIDPQSRQGTARIALAYAPALRPGGFAEARIVAGSAQVPLLPESAVMNDEQGPYVLIVGQDNKIERRGVTPGDINDRGIPIVGGLTGTERVVLTAGAFLNVGDVITPVTQPAASAQPGRPAAAAARPASPAAAAR